LWVVLSDPVLNPAKVLIVNLTGQYGYPTEDASCVLQPGEHEWITKPTLVLYSHAETRTAADLLRYRNSNRVVREYAAFSVPVLRRVLDGAARSPRLAIEFYDLLYDQGFISP
jgi:hypothetical protein